MGPRRLLALLCAPVLLLGGSAAAGRAVPSVPSVPSYRDLHGVRAAGDFYAGRLPTTPRARCGRGDRPEGPIQGRVPAADYANGRAAKGYTCNARVVAHLGTNGGFRVARYVDKHHHVCAFYDSTLLFPRDATDDTPGTYVLDMTDPRHPVRTAVLRSPAMISPHESLRVNARRGLVVAVMGSAMAQVGVIDVWDASQDCRSPVFRSSLPLALLGHEGAFSPDGMTYWASTTFTVGLTAVDLRNPSLPHVVWRSEDMDVHGLTFSDDGNRAYVATVPNFFVQTTRGGGGMTILDVSQVQRRVPNPQVRVVSFITWPEVTIPQNAIPVTIKGHPYAIEFDEYDSNVYQYTPRENVGAVHVIDISDERHPRLVSRIRLAVHNLAAREVVGDDPGVRQTAQGYAAHYCEVPRRHDPGILACSMILSGMRVFDIRDPLHPREVAYANQPVINARNPSRVGAFAMSAPAFDPARREIWYSDGNTGFYVVQLTRAAWPT